MNPNVKEVTSSDPSIQCNYCHKSEINSLEWGPMYQLDDVTVHYFCMLFSAGLRQNGQDEDGILGFLPKDIKKELKRGVKLKCKFCRRAGATIGCSTKSCKASYHYPCGLENNSVFQFIGNFESYCKTHREKVDIPYSEIDSECVICNEDVNENNFPLWAPCCKKRIFHKSCIMKLAKNAAAHFFRCPFCNDEDIFSVAMRKAGVYLPDRDATWEMEPDAFEDQAIIYRCDAEVCSCPKGREYSSSSESKPYKLAECGGCAGAAIHKKCGQLEDLTWKCQICTAIDIRSDKHYDTSDEEDAGDNKQILNLRDVISTVQPRYFEKSKFEESFPDSCVVERDEDESVELESEDANNVFVSARTRMYGMKLQSLSHRMKSAQVKNGSRGVLKVVNTECISEAGSYQSKTVQSTDSVCSKTVENGISRFVKYSEKLNDVTSSDNVSNPVLNFSPGNATPIAFPPLVKSKVIKVSSKADLRQIRHQPVATFCEPKVIKESTSRKVEIFSTERNEAKNRAIFYNIKMKNSALKIKHKDESCSSDSDDFAVDSTMRASEPQQQKLEVITLDDESSSDIEIVSEKIVTTQSRSSAFMDIVARAREKYNGPDKKPVVKKRDIETVSLESEEETGDADCSDSSFNQGAVELQIPVEGLEELSSKYYYDANLGNIPHDFWFNSNKTPMQNWQ